MKHMARVLRRHRIRWLMTWSVVLTALASGGCGDAPAPPATTTPAAEVSEARPPASPPATIRFTDVTTTAGLVFRHEAGATGKKDGAVGQ